MTCIYICFLTTASSSFFAAGFFSGTRGVGRDYKMAVYNVASAGTGTLSITEAFNTPVDDKWLKRKALCVCVWVYMGVGVGVHVGVVRVWVCLCLCTTE